MSKQDKRCAVVSLVFCVLLLGSLLAGNAKPELEKAGIFFSQLDWNNLNTAKDLN